MWSSVGGDFAFTTQALSTLAFWLNDVLTNEIVQSYLACSKIINENRRSIVRTQLGHGENAAGKKKDKFQETKRKQNTETRKQSMSKSEKRRTRKKKARIKGRERKRNRKRIRK